VEDTYKKATEINENLKGKEKGVSSLRLKTNKKAGNHIKNDLICSLNQIKNLQSEEFTQKLNQIL
jgi:hypothetical protein